MKKMKDAFNNVFEEGPEPNLFFAPGRVNLIGEHTDYNGGYVFPCSLDIGTYALARKRTDHKIKLYSMNFPEAQIIETNIDHIEYREDFGWANYPLGIIYEIMNHGNQLKQGIDILFYGNIPNGAGLSSSASIEMVTGVIIRDLFQFEINTLSLVKLAQKAENDFIGVNCGIMDQFAIGFGKKNHALFINCHTLDYKEVPVELDDYILVIANTNKRRGLGESAYNKRRQECDLAVMQLNKELDIENLSQLSPEVFEQYQHLIHDEVALKRARHVVYENHRTIEAVKKLNAGDLQAFGELMNSSHISLRDQYEVTGKELDTLVEAAWNQGAVGSRMTGAGFGGCTISIVNRNDVSRFISKVGAIYKREIGLEADFYPVEMADGAKKIEAISQ